MSEIQEIGTNTSRKNRPRRWWRRIWTWLWKSSLALLVFVMSLPFFLLLAWQVSIVRDGVRKIGLSIAGNMLVGELEIGYLGGNLWSGLEIRKAYWWTADKPRVLLGGFERLRVSYDLWHFVRKGELLVEEVYLENVAGHAELDAKGRLNYLRHIKIDWDKPPKPEPETSGERTWSFRLRVKDIQIRGVRGHWRGGPNETPIAARDLNLRADFSMQIDRRLHLKSRLKQLEFMASNPDIRCRNLSLDFEMVDRHLTAKNLVLLLGDRTELRLEAILDIAKDLRMQVNIQHLFAAREDIQKVMSAWPIQPDFVARIQVNGTLDNLQATIDGTLGDAALAVKAHSDLLRQTYDVDVSLQHIDLKQMLGNPLLESQMGVQLKAKGKGFSVQSDGLVSVRIPAGHIQHKYKFSEIDLQVRLKEAIASVQQMRIRTPFVNIDGGLRLSVLSGNIGGKIRAQVKDLKPIGDLLGQRLRGRVSLMAELQGEKWLPGGKVQAQISRFRHPSISLQKLNLYAKVSSLQPLRATLRLRSHGITAAGRNIQRLELNANYLLDGGVQRVGISQFSFDLGAGLFGLRRTATIALTSDKVAIKNLHWVNGKQQLQIDGWFDWNQWRQDLRVNVEQLQIASWQKALQILPNSRIDGVVSLQLRAAGSFARPRINFGLNLDNTGFRKFKGIYGHLSLDYQWSAKTRQLLAMSVDLSRQHQPNKQREQLIKLGLRLPISINLKQMSTQPLLLKRAFEFMLDIPALNLGLLGKNLDIPMQGQLRAAVNIGRTLGNPDLRFEANLTNGTWQQFKQIQAALYINYRDGRLQFSQVGDHQKVKDSELSIGGRRLLTISGHIPLLLELLERRRRLVLNYKLIDQAMRFAIHFDDQRIEWLLQMLAPQLSSQIAYLQGIIQGSAVISGSPSDPKFQLFLRLVRGSFCPWVDGRFVCRRESIQSKYFSKSRSMQKKHGKTKDNLRIKDLSFSLDLKYSPPKKGENRGQLTLNSLLNIGTQTILALGRYAQIQTQRDTIKNQAIVIPMIFKLDPQTLKPEFEIFDQNFHLPLQIPKLAINAEISQFSLAQFIHHPLLQNLRGNVAISLNAENSLSDPTINLMVRASELAYTLSQREDDNDFMVLDGIDYQLSVSIISKKIGISTRAKILNKHLMHAHALMDMHIGLDPRTFKVFHKPGQHVYANLTINEFKLEELAPYLGLTEQLYGKVQGFFEIYGDPACPNFGKQKRKGIAQNYLEISNGYFGVPRSKYAQIATQSKSSTSVPALIFDKFRLAFRTLSDGRVDIRLGMWSPQHRASKQPDMLNGVFQGPLPFQLFPLAAKEMKTQRRCLHWSGGKPSEALEVLLSTGERGLPLHFIESFVEGMRLDAYLKFAVKMGGTLSQPLIHPGGVSMQIKQILYQDYGLRIATNINNNNSLRHKCRQLVNADNSRRKMQHIEGCIYSFVNLGFNTDRYQLDVRLQGSSGAPLIITGNVPHKSFVPKSLDFSAYAEKGNFQPMWTSRYRMAMRPNLRISGDFNAPQIRGNLLIPQMLFSLPESSGRPSNFSDDPDLIVIGEKSEERLLSKEQKITIAKQPGILDKMFADISIIIPRNFRIRNREIEIEARTDEFRNMRVLLQKGILHLSGGIEVVRGELSFYTKKFAIKPGSSVTFTGQALSFEQFGQLNAQLNITASYALNVSKGTSLDKKGHKRLNILLAISGTIQQPTIDLSVQDASTEQIIAMDKASIIALILTGSTTDDLTTGQQQGLTDQALGILGKAVAAQLRNTLSDVMPLDVLKIETGAKAEDLKVELGWYLTRSIYLQLLARPLPLEEDNYWELLFDIALSRSWSLELRFGQMKRSNTPLFRGSTHLYFRMKY